MKKKLIPYISFGTKLVSRLLFFLTGDVIKNDFRFNGLKRFRLRCGLMTMSSCLNMKLLIKALNVLYISNELVVELEARD